MMSKKIQNNEDVESKKILCWVNKKNVKEEEEGADGPAGDSWCTKS